MTEYTMAGLATAGLVLVAVLDCRRMLLGGGWEPVYGYLRRVFRF